MASPTDKRIRPKSSTKRFATENEKNSASSQNGQIKILGTTRFMDEEAGKCSVNVALQNLHRRIRVVIETMADTKQGMEIGDAVIKLLNINPSQS